MFYSKGKTAFIYRILCTLHVSILEDYKIIKEERTHRVTEYLNQAKECEYIY